MMVGYNAQMAVDAKHKLTPADDVTNEVTDFKQLANVALTAKTNLELQQAEVVADAGYYNAVEVSRCGRARHHGLRAQSGHEREHGAGLYGKSRFRYDEAKDVYVCPAGAELTHRFNTNELGRELRYYRASGCKGCALKKQCTRNKANRTITREENEHLMEAMAARMAAQPWKFKLRKGTGRTSFWDDQALVWVHALLLKGLEKVQTEWSLTTLALQPQTGLRRAVAGFVPAKAGVEPGELRETDVGSRSESPAKRLKRAAAPFFSFVGSRNSGKCSHHSPAGIFHLGRKTSNREKYFPFLLLTVNPAGSFHTASRFVRRLLRISLRAAQLAGDNKREKKAQQQTTNHGKITVKPTTGLATKRKPTQIPRQSQPSPLAIPMIEPKMKTIFAPTSANALLVERSEKGEWQTR